MSRGMFLSLFRRYIEAKQTEAKHQLKATTVRGYANKYMIVVEYLNDIRRTDLHGKEFNIPFAKNMFMKLIDKYKHNYVVRILEMCKAVLEYATINGFISHNPIAYFRMKKAKPEKPPYLTNEQIESYLNYVTFDERKKRAILMIRIQLLTSFDYGDLKEIDPDCIVYFQGRQYLSKPRCKNGNEQIIPLTGKLKELLEENNFKIPLISNPEYNELIKVITTELKIPYRLSSKSLRKIALMHRLNNEGFSMEAVSKIAGHKTTRTTEAYYAQVNIQLIHNELVRMEK